MARGLRGRESQTVEQRFSMWDLSGSGVESMSSALAGRSFTTGEASLLARSPTAMLGFVAALGPPLAVLSGVACPAADHRLQLPSLQQLQLSGGQSWLAGSGALRHVESSRPGTEPASPASAGGLLSPVSPGKLFYILTFFIGVGVLCTSIVGRTK